MASTVSTGNESHTRERILAVAAQRFLAAGYVETSLRDLADDAGMKAGSLYYHFSSKDDLLAAVLERGMTIMVDAFNQAAIAGRGDDAQSVLHRHISAHLRALHHNRPYTAVHVTLFRTAPASVRETIVPLRDDYERMWTNLLARLLPERSPGDITMLRLSLFGSMNASIGWFDTGRGTVDTFADLVSEQFWYGAAGRSIRSAEPVNPVDRPTVREQLS